MPLDQDFIDQFDSGFGGGASNPGGCRLSEGLLGYWCPELFGDPLSKKAREIEAATGYTLAGWRDQIRDQLMEGDARAAMVLSAEHCLAAAYSDELDAILPLVFPEALRDRLGLKDGDRLLTINVYNYKSEVGLVQDLTEGEKASGTFGNFQPFIAEFMSEDAERIAACKAAIPEEEWQRCEQLGRRYLREHKTLPRLAQPYESGCFRITHKEWYEKRTLKLAILALVMIFVAKLLKGDSRETPAIAWIIGGPGLALLWFLILYRFVDKWRFQRSR